MTALHRLLQLFGPADDSKFFSTVKLQLQSKVLPRPDFVRGSDDAVSSAGGEAVDRRFPMNDVVVHELTIPFLR